MMAAVLLLMLQPPDTLLVTAGELLRRAAETPVVRAAQERARASEARVWQAGLLPNPTFSGTVENLAWQEEVTGETGWAGSEGQLVVGSRIRLGGDGSAARRVEQAGALGARAAVLRTEAEVGVRVVEAVAEVLRDGAFVDLARQEFQGIARLEEAVRLQAELGRASDGEAARLALARTSAEVTVARMEARRAVSRSELLRLTGLPAEPPLSLSLTRCTPLAPLPGVRLPELEEAEARVRGWEAIGAELQARAIPDLLPEAGIRRSGGVDALYLGVSVELPLFDRNQGAREAARREALAAAAEVEGLERRLAAEHTAAMDALRALESAGSRFDAQWDRALDRTTEAAEARYTLGEGTLTEVLDGRRARLQALSDREDWRAEWLAWRARVARSSGQPITEQILCTPDLQLDGADGTPGFPGEEIRP